ncbi:hypothetical protein R69776_06988 [Paraburkholderia nemoris]|uniref:Uncharacterized protein n=1 Tax=Paraburkholderia nemoris TaxID=2793076 RepID=A0ABN7MZD0_9BURK|nr:hypothetical protein R75777_01262 [Paraburkholderia nemoris]CAE6839818.1 hypothetical protein R69776_06988 [Paraburkholderia nemoris]
MTEVDAGTDSPVTDGRASCPIRDTIKEHRLHWFTSDVAQPHSQSYPDGRDQEQRFALSLVERILRMHVGFPANGTQAAALKEYKIRSADEPPLRYGSRRRHSSFHYV